VAVEESATLITRQDLEVRVGVRVGVRGLLGMVGLDHGAPALAQALEKVAKAVAKAVERVVAVEGEVVSLSPYSSPFR
jgi:hypothetical protein